MQVSKLGKKYKQVLNLFVAACTLYLNFEPIINRSVWLTPTKITNIQPQIANIQL